MKKWMMMSVCAALMAASATALLADSLAEQKKAQNKLLAYRAARADAVRKLAERVKGLKITSDTTVKDFVTESDTIRTALDTYLIGAQESGEPKYMEDGTCSLTMKVTLVDVITDLKKIHNACYKGSKFKVNDFEQMTQTNEVKEIEETGSGANRADLGEAVEIPSGKSAESLDMPRSAAAYWKAHVTGQGRLLAVRAARVDAMRRLVERIKGTNVMSETVVRDFVTESDVVKLATAACLKGAKETGIRYHNDELIVEVTMQVKLRTVIDNIRTIVEEKYKGDHAKIKEFTELTRSYEDTIITETGSGVPREDTLKDVPAAQKAVLDMTTNVPDWAKQTLRVKGSSAMDTELANKAQAKLMAFRGAELDARRKIAEQLNGLVIDSKTTVKDFVTQDDQIRTRMLAFQQGASVIEGSQKLAEDGTATVEVEIDLRPLWDTVVEYKSKTVQTSAGTEVTHEKMTVKATPVAEQKSKTETTVASGDVPLVPKGRR